ncbi:hypothetical protein ACI6Q2_04060 [Chitinophagaceae bacterium LWZ2-11]
MKDLKECVRELNRLIIAGKTIEAMEVFYHNDVTMQENNDTVREGKQVCIDHEKKVLERTKEIKSKLISQAIDEVNSVVLSEWEFVFVNKENHTFIIQEVAVQRWKDDHIYQETFYHNGIRQI